MKNENKLDLIAKLQYQIQRYQATGNGVMCQLLNAKLRKLMNGEEEKECMVTE